MHVKRSAAARARRGPAQPAGFTRSATKEQGGWRRKSCMPAVRRLSMSPTATLPVDGRVLQQSSR